MPGSESQEHKSRTSARTRGELGQSSEQWLIGVAACLVVALTLASQAFAGAGKYANLIAPASVCPGANSTTAAAAEQAKTMICMINYARAKAGVKKLPSETLLAGSAVRKAKRIVKCGKFTHYPCGDELATPFRQAGYIAPGYRWTVGENLAWGSGAYASPTSVLKRWLESPPHRKNLLSSRWREQGVAVVRAARLFGYDNVSIWVNHFGTRTG